jgi:quinol monooxygenase YgiN
MLALRLHMTFTPETCEEAAGVLRSLVGPVRAERGCNATQLLRNAGGENGLTWIEEWRGAEDFERHLRSAVFRRILAVIDLAAGPPRVEIDDVASRRGFDLVEEILGRTPEKETEYEAG